MSAAVWLVTILLLAALAHVGGNGDQEITRKTLKRNAWQQLCDGLCALVLRAAHLAFTIHRSFQAWVQNSLSQAELDVQELLQGDDTEELTEKRQHLADFLQSLPQRPEHFAVILPEANECSQGGTMAFEVDAVETLCTCALLAKVPRLTVYTRNGSLKTSFDEIAYRLRKSSMTQRVTANGRMARICLDDGKHVEYSGGDDMDVDADLCIERPLSLHVSLWSRDNGYPALARLARELAGQAECGRLPSGSIDESYVATKLVDAAGHQHPDLVLLYDDLVCIPDFPPWQLQNSEVFQVGSATARSLGNAVLSAFASYANIEKRFGK
ncbi:hypothetical protein GGH94_004849 [Coemansia aciculifera]|uniref:ditrans,polycis-polyprenyl diphosphate synthase [(2E,6E)-farnesyldiphosphate specific] n=1 Tax=Coemansia aciculifera TaxID=417176 RepID=A0A9W8M4V6_9FUNG|nr:hypothetical protein GGH94_004849 [Coemansia aciculifera]KAJ2875604.1 hypothetical protein GGH93_001478 [Coemansia aciculifera]